MQKSLLCEGHQIPFDYMGDAAKLNFMASLDIAALIGNALDNAIEREMAESADTRFINMTIKTMGEILLIHVANPCSQPLTLKDGLRRRRKGTSATTALGYGACSTSSRSTAVN